MRIQRSVRVWGRHLGGATLLLLGLSLLGLWFYHDWPGANPNAQGAALPTAHIAQVWQNVRNSSQYTFNADITITNIPLPTAGNIGRFSKTDSLYLEGTNNLDDSTMQMALWGGGVSVADRANAYQVRVQDGDYQTRVGDGEWQSSSENAVAFAPEGNFLAFLELAKNVKLAQQPTTTSKPEGKGTQDDQLTRYTFDLEKNTHGANSG